MTVAVITGGGEYLSIFITNYYELIHKFEVNHRRACRMPLQSVAQDSAMYNSEAQDDVPDLSILYRSVRFALLVMLYKKTISLKVTRSLSIHWRVHRKPRWDLLGRNGLIVFYIGFVAILAYNVSVYDVLFQTTNITSFT